MAYRLSPREIAELTPHQQLALYDPEAFQDVLYFDTMEEYSAWLRTRRN